MFYLGLACFPLAIALLIAARSQMKKNRDDQD
jgi:hypothetical protein